MSLVEVAVALVLLGAGVSASATAGTAAVRMSTRAQASSLAIARAGSIADSLADVEDVRADSSQDAYGRFAWTVQPSDDAAVRVDLRVVIAGTRDTLLFPLIAAPAMPGID